MIKKIKKYLLNDLKNNYKLYIALIFITLLFVIKFDYYIYSPGGLVDLSNRIKVDSSNESKGSFNLTYVTARNANVVNIILSYIIPSWDMVSIENMRIDNESEKEIFNRDQIYLKQSSYDAIISAFKEANIDYNIDSIDVTITYVYSSSNTNLKTSDIIKKINGVTINDFNDLKNELSNYKQGDRINITVLRGKKIIECYSVLNEENGRVIIGVQISEIKNVTTNPKVEFVFKDNESGSSRGLMCALDIYNKITAYDLTKGKIISGTGSIDENGNVGEISGVKYKLLGAHKKGANIFIVPTNNYEEALKTKEENNMDIVLIKADNIHNVINELKKL